MTMSITWRGIFAAALASSLVGGLWFATPSTATAIATHRDSAVTPPQTKIDPHWRALIAQIDRAAPKPQVQPAQAHVFAPTVHLNLSTGILSGRVNGSGAIAITVRRGGVPVLIDNTRPVFEGSIYTYVDPLIGRIALRADDVVELSQANQTGSVSMTVPGFSAAIDAQADLVAGYVTSHTVVHVQVNAYTTPTLVAAQDASVTADNTFTANLGSLIDIRPRDTGFAWVDINSDMHIYRSFSAPLLQVEAGGSIVASPNVVAGPSQLDVLDALGNLRARLGPLTSSENFVIPLTFTLNIGDRVIAHANDIFSDIVITIPRLSVQPDANGTHLIGDAPPNATVELRVFNGLITDQPGSLFGSVLPITRVLTTADAQGKYSAALTLTPTSYVFAVYTTPSGHEVFARYTQPYIRVRLGPVNIYHSYGGSGYEVVGQFGPIYEPLTITVQGASGYQKIERYMMSGDAGYFSDPLSPYGLFSSPATVETGDVVTVSTHSGNVQAVQVPEFQVSADSRNHTVFGTAPPNSIVKLLIPRYYYAAQTFNPHTTREISNPDTVVPPQSGYVWSTVITTSASGTFSITLPEFATYSENLIGEAELTLANGNAVARPFTDIGACRPYVSSLLVGGNRITLANAFCPMEQFQAQLWSRDGRLKWSWNQLNTALLELIEPDVPYSPVLIEGGDQIRLYRDSYSETTTVPTLTLAANRIQNSINGSTLPSATVAVSIYLGEPVPYIPYIANLFGVNYFTQTVADSAGHYHIAFGSALTLTAGTLVEASIVDQQIVAITRDAIPVLSVFPSTYVLNGRLKPFAPYTFTLTNSAMVTNSLLRYAELTGNIDGMLGQIIRPNDQIQLDSPTFSTTIRVPNLTAEIDVEKGVLFGLGPPNTQLAVWQWGGALLYYGAPITTIGTLTVNAAGQYSLTLPASALTDRANLKISVGYNANETVRIWQDATVNDVRWYINLDDHSIFGTLPSNTDIITLTVRKASNPAVELAADVLANWSPVSFYARFDKPLDSNDVLVLKTSSGNYTFTLPLFNVAYSDAIRYLPVITGRTQPTSQITVIIAELAGQFYGQPVQRSITSDRDGRWGIDLSDVRPKLNSKIRIIFQDPFNNRVERNITAALLNLALPVVLRN